MSHAQQQAAKGAHLWARWRATHELATAALSSAVNIQQRLEVLAELRNYGTLALEQQQQQGPQDELQQQHDELQQQQDEQQQRQDEQQQRSAPPSLQELVVGKQLVAFDRALALVRNHHAVLQDVVRDMERLFVEAARGLSSSSSSSGGGALLSCAAAVPCGPQPSPMQLVDALQDVWVMCRDELLLKLAVVGLVTLDAPPADMAALLQCYADQPNVKPDAAAVLALAAETAPRKEAR